ncbi:MAG: 1-acyl-sn-glycerol-3-phosphate acyltransferase [Planctomycetota bacterium]
MDIQPFQVPPRWWSPKLSRWWVLFWRPLRRRLQLKTQRLLKIDVRGLEHLQNALKAEHGVLITPNHSAHADTFVICDVADRLSRPFYFMAAWQVFGKIGALKRLILRQHGCFSVDREGSDMRAFRQAVDILQHSSNPLIIFPEGEVYHLNDRVTPFKEGPAVIAMTAAKRAKRSIVCVPCGIKYEYIQDPTDELIELMGRLEERILWRRRADLSLPERIYRFAEAAIALKEQEYLGHTQTGSLSERISSLSNKVLKDLQERYKVHPPEEVALPERVKALRKEAIERLEAAGNDENRTQMQLDLDDLFFVTQLFSYPGDYVSGKPTVERMAETLDKFEEDVLNMPTATIRGARRAIISFGEPIAVASGTDRKKAAHAVTGMLEQRVQMLLDDFKPTET